MTIKTKILKLVESMESNQCLQDLITFKILKKMEMEKMIKIDQLLQLAQQGNSKEIEIKDQELQLN